MAGRRSQQRAVDEPKSKGVRVQGAGGRGDPRGGAAGRRRAAGRIHTILTTHYTGPTLYCLHTILTTQYADYTLY